MQNRHISIGTSHGRYFNGKEWKWQRPPLYCTTEDLFTQTITIPFLIPMLERSGAIVYSPRERDWQKNEAVVDNDGGILQGSYQEENGIRKWQNSAYAGFAHLKRTYSDGENPFFAGTARICALVDSEKHASVAQWIPEIPEDGNYAVYVTYQSFYESAPDAKYIVYHQGGATEISVNQQMGGGTWTYLGTFEFKAGQNSSARVILTNQSEHKGVVCADAVRFGGGMGNISRDPVSGQSGMPRFLEGARYAAQWSGFPYKVYGMYEGENDYKDDINVRSFTTNYLNGGSIFNPDSLGLHVPIEAQFSFHSDAGFRSDDSFIGPLTICSTESGDTTKVYPGGIDRMVSYSLASQILHNAKRDLDRTFGIDWPAREVRNRDYSESRRGNVPSMIFEMLSHQNWADIRYGHDPNFKFILSRSIYKTISRYVNGLHDRPSVVAPLPVQAFAIQRTEKDNQILLSWQPTTDTYESEAKPSGYVLYTRLNEGGFDNGRWIPTNTYSMEVVPGTMYSFKVTAVNDGGESLDSEILCAYISPKERKRDNTIMIINGFCRLSGPKPINTETEIGFDLSTDAGVPYMSFPGYCGAQIGFNKSGLGIETEEGAGFSGKELEGMIIAGNTFDYPSIHGRAIRSSDEYSFVSCSKLACEIGAVELNEYGMVDLILGLEKDDGWSLFPYKTFNPKFQKIIKNYMDKSGRILVSGAFIASDMQSKEEQRFTSEVLKYAYDAPMDTSSSSTSSLAGCGINFTIPRTLNEKQYAVQSCDCLRPTDTKHGFPSFAYNENQHCAGIAYKKNDYRVLALGFPFESVTSAKDRSTLMTAMLQFLMK
ncbi:MAG: xanthan lyase [Bacteroidaceae bacterium]|nr:xanthan lyase [Bacteroidaceae bacterium]